MNTFARFITDAMALIPYKDYWCQHSIAQDQNGRTVGTNEETAVKFCAVGCMHRVHLKNTHPRNTYFEVREKADEYVFNKGYHSIGAFNDDSHTTYQDILDMFNHIKNEQLEPTGDMDNET